ncbi:MAG: hypothetical protein IJO60_11420 [Agathobacter sp.]|nr:hypothetical protein [Agathobacter sp.]
MKKKILKIAALVTAFILIVGLSWLGNALLGNPVSKMLATNTAKKYLAETYSETDFYIERITYSFKDSNYHAFIKSPSSIDTEFSLTISMFGKLKLDTYDDVLNGFNTAIRVDTEYRKLVDTIFEHPNFPYSGRIGYGTLEIYPDEFIEIEENYDIPSYSIAQSSLELDKIYDIRELGRQAGHIIIYVESDTVSIEKTAEMMLDIKSYFDEANIPFVAMDFTLQYMKSEDGTRPDEEIHVKNFHYEDIYVEGMNDRVLEAHNALTKYYNKLDEEKFGDEIK